MEAVAVHADAEDAAEGWVVVVDGAVVKGLVPVAWELIKGQGAHRSTGYHSGATPALHKDGWRWSYLLVRQDAELRLNEERAAWYVAGGPGDPFG